MGLRTYSSQINCDMCQSVLWHQNYTHLVIFTGDPIILPILLSLSRLKFPKVCIWCAGWYSNTFQRARSKYSECSQVITNTGESIFETSNKGTGVSKRSLYLNPLLLSPPHWVRLLNWFQILYGWVASPLFVAIVSGMSRRSDME